MGLRPFLKLAGPVLLVFFLGLLFFYGRNYQTKEIGGQLDFILTECLVSGELEYGCLREKFRPLVKSFSLEKIVYELEYLFSQESSSRPFGTLSCHAPAHILGELEIEKGSSFVEVAKACQGACNYGCIHGAFIGSSQEHKDFLLNLSSFCKQFGEKKSVELSCHHMLGHALSDVYANDFAEALNQCMRMSSLNDRMSCANGAIMERLLGSPETIPPKIANKEDLLDFCGSLPPDYGGICFGSIGYYSYAFLGRGGLDICSQVPKENAPACVYSIGDRAYYDFRNSPKELVNFCKKFTDNSLKCVLGAIETSLALDPEGKFARDTCWILEGESFTECTSFVREKSN